MKKNNKIIILSVIVILICSLMIYLTKKNSFKTQPFNNSLESIEEDIKAEAIHLDNLDSELSDIEKELESAN